eukprot:jgi/Undpi1/9351/HiC_scaffold_26.g11809.m1
MRPTSRGPAAENQPHRTAPKIAGRYSLYRPHPWKASENKPAGTSTKTSREKSEHATADLFKGLMENNAPVNVAKAQAAGGGDAEERMGDDAAASAKELLMCLPGVNVHNYRNVLRGVDTIADLSGLSLEQLEPMLGKGNASKLHTFFRQHAPL